MTADATIQFKSQRDFIIQPSVDGPSRTGEERLRWECVKPNTTTLNGSYRVGHRNVATSLGLNIYFGREPGAGSLEPALG